MNEKKEEFNIYPIGYVKQINGEFYIEILKPFIPALKELEHFSHAQVFWWAHINDNKESRNTMQVTPPYGENPPVTGVFATRAEFRPNPIALTAVNILEVNHDKGLVKIPFIDAFDGTPVIDIKGYFPVCDRVREAFIPPWLKGWPEWYEDAAEWAAEQGFFEEESQ